jgi:hypothetical protein
MWHVAAQDDGMWHVAAQDEGTWHVAAQDVKLDFGLESIPVFDLADFFNPSQVIQYY